MSQTSHYDDILCAKYILAVTFLTLDMFAVVVQGFTQSTMEEALIVVQ